MCITSWRPSESGPQSWKSVCPICVDDVAKLCCSCPSWTSSISSHRCIPPASAARRGSSRSIQETEEAAGLRWETRRPVRHPRASPRRMPVIIKCSSLEGASALSLLETDNACTSELRRYSDHDRLLQAELVRPFGFPVFRLSSTLFSPSFQRSSCDCTTDTPRAAARDLGPR